MSVRPFYLYRLILLQYGMTRLKLQCEAHLLTITSVNNVCEIIIIADLHQSENLKKEAMQFLVNNAKEVP